ncbi:hypothetical protein SAMN03159496_03912 [Rhizobium sp. NFR07]|uniref:hypothetical protein n=1 Tax=Rhizobium sp. NFR07 TaxID=1566262 RepID=UPI0008E864C0|nr:hypothetical protein [Rhizobium sp. NFR07]SFB45898.1 hypothetical protein SAMN03159496_03912 [Rhizobium sp. NFR07]
MYDTARSSIVAAYFERIEQAGIQKRYQVDIFVGNSQDAPPANEAHFVLARDGFWIVENWSRGTLQDASAFSAFSDALDYSYNMISGAPEFRKIARNNGYNPPSYDFDGLVEALSIAFRQKNVEFSILKSTREMTASEGDQHLTLAYSDEDKAAEATVYQLKTLNSKFDNLSNALCYLYWRFSPNDVIS